MATANFMTYEDLPGLYFLTEEEAQTYDYEQLEKYRVLEDWEIEDLKDFISDCNLEIYERACRLQLSNRDCDQPEFENIDNTRIVLKPGYYEGYQIAVEGEYHYCNQTSKNLIRKLFMKIARRFSIPVYRVAYRFSNGETGYTKVRTYGLTKKERLALGW